MRRALSTSIGKLLRIAQNRCYRDSKSPVLQDRAVDPVKGLKVSKLKSEVEDVTKALASRVLNFKTCNSLLECNQRGTHPDVYDDIPGDCMIEHISYTPLQLLWTAISSILPADPLNNDVTTLTGDYHHVGPNVGEVNCLQLGWHLVLSNVPVMPERLCTDGTNTRFMPGEEQVWPYRLWAGGSIKLNSPLPWSLQVDPVIHVTERAVSFRVKGQPEPQQALVTVRKEFVPILNNLDVDEYTPTGLLRALTAEPSIVGEGRNAHLQRGPAWTEDYTLCFLRNSPGSTFKSTRVIRPPGSSDFSHTLVPNRHLLFCWSALTRNAHLIHIDTATAQQVYGAPNLLVHGPLTVFLVCEWFRRVLTSWTLEKQPALPFVMRSIEYRNLQPLYVDEPITLRAKAKASYTEDLPGAWDVWIQKGSGSSLSMAFKATIKVEVGTVAGSVEKEKRND